MNFNCINKLLQSDVKQVVKAIVAQDLIATAKSAAVVEEDRTQKHSAHVLPANVLPASAAVLPDRC